MKKKILTILMLGLVLSSCGKDKKEIANNTSIENTSDESIKEDINDKLKTKKKDINDRLITKNKKNENKNKGKNNKSQIKRNGQYQDIYDRLKNKKLYITGGSMVEALYFYRDGYFDGVEKGGNGGHVSIALYNGKFDITEKLTDTSYKLVLQRLDNDLKVGTEKNININGYDNTFHYGESIAMPKESIGSETVLYLPETKYGDLDKNAIDFIKMMKNINNDTKMDPNEKIGVFLLAHNRQNDTGATYFIEYVK